MMSYYCYTAIVCRLLSFINNINDVMIYLNGNRKKWQSRDFARDSTKLNSHTRLGRPDDDRVTNHSLLTARLRHISPDMPFKSPKHKNTIVSLPCSGVNRWLSPS